MLSYETVCHTLNSEIGNDSRHLFSGCEILRFLEQFIYNVQCSSATNSAGQII